MAPGCEGYNSLFFKKTWRILGEEVIAAVIEFFESAYMCKAINCRTITLILEVQNPTNIKEFKPISCSTVLYKMISKVLTTRLHDVMAELIDNCQATVVPGRLITDNIIMSHELVKGYGRKNISPRCMLKIDMQKAYDSVEWVYIEQVMRLLSFPEVFVKLIMACTRTVSYSVLIIGKLYVPFKARKGLRQGDPLSSFLFVLAMEYLSRSLKILKVNKQFIFDPRCAKLNLVQLGFADDLLLFCRENIQSIKILHQHFQMFSPASGLIANPNKSYIYFGGVNNLLQQQIMVILGYTKYELPFRYLGVPLSTKRLSAIQCKPLIERMLSRIQSWTAKFLSYAGRAVLVKRVLFAIQTFWAQIFILPKKIIHFIEAICRRFLWKGNVEPTMKALIAWDKLCAPKVAGRLNFINVEMWKKEAICKLLWSICTRKEKLWVLRRAKKARLEEVKWLEQVSKGKSAGASVCRMTLAAAVYHIWQERNNVIFQKKRRTSNAILRLIIQEIHVRAVNFSRLDRAMAKLNWYPEAITLQLWRVD
nr:uncharacterized protein LOC104114523 [Nicotiana tomentosiformis]